MQSFPNQEKLDQLKSEYISKLIALKTHIRISGNKFSLGFAGCIHSLEVKNHFSGIDDGQQLEHKKMASFHGTFKQILEVC